VREAWLTKLSLIDLSAIVYCSLSFLGTSMPTISMFYGIIIRMYYFDNQQHNTPHIHAHYQEFEAIIEIPSGKLLEGSLQNNKQKLVDAWVEIHADELMADWQLAVNGDAVFKIEPLR
jgi:hypothetical protein